jgi:hypothetical protein
VPAQKKRRRIPLLSLPIVIVTGFLLVAWLAAWQQSDIVADLTDRVAHGETRDAMDAVGKLSAMSNPPIPVLVSAAASDERETAESAQVAIDRLLRRWQREIDAEQRTSTIRRQLSELAQSLAEGQREFSDADLQWLESTARKILRIANKFPAMKTPLVAVHCDAILTNVGKTSQKSENRFSQPATELSSPSAGVLPDRQDVNQATDGETSSAKAPERLETSQRADSSSPVFRILPPTSSESSIVPNSTPAIDARMQQASPDMRLAFSERRDRASSRELLQSWLASTDAERRKQIEQELARRGFGRLVKPLVQQYFSEDPRERMQLVDRVLAQPGVGSSAWLLLLAEDADAEVRLLAITFIATSNDAQLVEKAWQVAIRDHDPRIADLAGRLRDRRSAWLRR